MLIREEPGGRAERLVVSPGLDADVRSRQRLHRCLQASSGKRLLRYTVRDNCDETLECRGRGERPQANGPGTEQRPESAHLILSQSHGAQASQELR